jgi:cytochrome c oxidase cbb3-type subunit 1
MIIYRVGLTFGGIWQGVMMNDPDIPFLDIVGRMIPSLWSRSLAGVLMTAGHVAFGISVWHMLRRKGVWLVGPTLFTSGRTIRTSLQPKDSPQHADSATREPSVEGVS